MKNAKEVKARINEIIAELNLQDVSIERGSKSLAVTITGPAGKRTFFAPLTPSCWRAAKNMKTDIKRLAIAVEAFVPKHV